MRGLTRVLAPALILAVVGCGDDAVSPAAPEVDPVLASGTTQTLSFRQVSAGSNHSCGVTTDDRAYCWGNNFSGQLGDGSTAESHEPVAVSGGLRFRQVVAGHFYTCGVTTDFRAYCWGSNGEGSLGDGTTTDRSTPTAVAGGRRFRNVDASVWSGHTCGVTYPDNLGYCWGMNTMGQVGDWTTTRRLSPVAVSGGRRYRQIATGDRHTCGATQAGEVFCWGYNGQGQIGNGSTVERFKRPVKVASTQEFVQVDAGLAHSCAVTSGDRAFCWGAGESGQIGDGRTAQRRTPTAVAGTVRFERVTTGNDHTCGESARNRAYCWGNNARGQLGDGTNTRRLVPRAVVGGLWFKQLSGGSFHTCGLASTTQAYCWGENTYGQLGDGTTDNRNSPTPVTGSS